MKVGISYLLGGQIDEHFVNDLTRLFDLREFIHLKGNFILTFPNFSNPIYNSKIQLKILTLKLNASS